MGPAGEADEAATGEAAKDPAGEEMVNDQPSSSSAPASSRYLKIGDDLFVSIPGVGMPVLPMGIGTHGYPTRKQWAWARLGEVLYPRVMGIHTRKIYG